MRGVGSGLLRSLMAATFLRLVVAGAGSLPAAGGGSIASVGRGG